MKLFNRFHARAGRSATRWDGAWLAEAGMQGQGRTSRRFREAHRLASEESAGLPESAGASLEFLTCPGFEIDGRLHRTGTRLPANDGQSHGTGTRLPAIDGKSHGTVTRLPSNDGKKDRPVTPSLTIDGQSDGASASEPSNDGRLHGTRTSAPSIHRNFESLGAVLASETPFWHLLAPNRPENHARPPIRCRRAI
jgi:hypothetical protein